VVETRVLDAVRNHFRPEFLNRIDDMIVFDRLTRDDLRKIVDIQLSDLRRRLEARRVDLVVNDEALDLLADRGYDPVYGARPLKRLLQTSVADPLAKGLLEGTFSDGDTIKVTVDNDELAFGA
jgi:ATP-dependent Clp protease ATP-binding subunit ClpB